MSEVNGNLTKRLSLRMLQLYRWWRRWQARDFQ
jgi:hypothetical protein